MMTAPIRIVDMETWLSRILVIILLCVRFVVVVLVLDLSLLRVMIRRVGFTH